MDEVDVKIIRELVSPHSFQWDVRKSFAAIASKVNVDEDTVRARLNRFYEEGSIQHWELVINPSLLGLRMGRIEVMVDDPSGKEILLSRLKLIDGVRWITNYFGNLLAVIFLFENEQSLKRRIDLISSISGTVLSSGEVPFPKCGINLSATDWRIVQSLRKDPRKSYAIVARELKLSARTVRRRVGQMTDARAFFLEADLDLRKLRGSVLCHLRVRYVDQKRAAELYNHFLSKLENVVWANGDSPTTSMFVTICDSIADVNEIVKRIRAVDGVTEVRGDIPEERITIHDWLDEQIAKKLVIPAAT